MWVSVTRLEIEAEVENFFEIRKKWNKAVGTHT
jgi:hypothetical protein